MFILSELKSTVKVHPSLFSKPLSKVVEHEFNRKLANKVLYNVGLMICFKEVVSFGDSSILPADGSSHTDVIFRFIVFRPEIGSILTGKIKSCTKEGIYVTLGFFDDIFIPRDELQHPSRFEEQEQAWVWEYQVDESTEQKHDLFLDIDDTIKFRVIDEEFLESEPTGPSGENSNQTTSSTSKTDYRSPPYKIVGAINEQGLGLENWWKPSENIDDDEEDETG